MSDQTEVVYARKVIQSYNVGVFVNEVVAAVKEGWDIDEQNPAGMYGYHFEVHLLKDEKLIDKSPTRADIAANARSAKKLKAEKPVETPTPEVA